MYKFNRRKKLLLKCNKFNDLLYSSHHKIKFLTFDISRCLGISD